MAEERLFCSKPFKRFEVSHVQGGNVYVCCSAWLKTPIGNMKDQSVAEIWNSQAAQEIRASILDGSFSHCNRSRCPFLQTVTGPVQKLSDVKDPELLAAIEEERTVLPHGPRELNCAYDRSCNLSCPTCRTELVVETRRKNVILDIQRKLNDEALKDADYISITGSGDPFGSPYFRQWLRTMKLSDMPRLKMINLHTNAQLWTPEMWETIDPGVRKLVTSTEISIDAATPETYAVNRRGGEFSILLKNLEFIAELRRKGPLQKVKISMVVQENNFREMPAFVQLGAKFGFDTVYFSQLVNWGTFKADEFKARAIHLPEHPRRGELQALLKDPVFADKRVHLGNLTETKAAAAA